MNVTFKTAPMFCLRFCVLMFAVFMLTVFMLTGCGNNTSPQPKAVNKPSTIPLGPVDYLENLGKQRKGMKQQIEGLEAQQRTLAEEYEKLLSRPRRRPTTAPPEPDKPEIPEKPDKLEKPAEPDGDSGDADTTDKDAK